MKHITIKLNETIEKLGITMYKLSVESKVRYPTVYNLCHGNSQLIKLETLQLLMDGLNDLAEKKGLPPIELTDVIDYE